MGCETETSDVSNGPLGGGVFSWAWFLVWLAGCFGLGALTAWAASGAENYFAPLVIFPLLTGVLLGAMVVGAMRVAQVGNRPTIVSGALLAATVAVVGQHYFQYLETYAEESRPLEAFRLAAEKYPDEVIGQPPRPPGSLAEFMTRQAERGRKMGLFDYTGSVYTARGAMAWVSWTVDGLLVLAAGMAMVIPATRQPYCSRCRSWYRVTRGARIDVAVARRIAQVAEVAESEEPRSARCRMLNCHGGCGPTALELVWQESGGGTVLVRAWLTPELRRRIVEVLDDAVESVEE